MTIPAKIQHLRITQRDVDLDLFIYEFGGCSIEQAARRFWPVSDKKYGSRSAWYRRINQLIDADNLKATRLAALSGVGSGKLFLTLGENGKAVVAETLGLSRSELKQQSRTKTPYIGSHHLAIGDVHLSLLLATERSAGAVELTEWTSEPDLRARRANKEVDPRLPIADAEFVLTLADGSSQGFRLEVDLTGSTSPRRFKQKLHDYLSLVALDGRRVLWVVSSDARADLVAAWCQEAAKELKADPGLFCITTSGLIHEDTALKGIWTEVGGSMIGLVPEETLTVPSPHRPIEKAENGGTPWTREHLS
jgi:hypothetical protein